MAAGDEGARRAVAPLTPYALRGVEHDHQNPDEEYWTQILLRHPGSLLVCGTSDSAAGRAFERSARRAAHRAGTPVVAIEDFAGNYFEVEGAATACVFVESAAAAAIARAKFGPTLAFRVLSPARYDDYRTKAPRLREVSASHGSPTAPAVLWAGQPETADCELTLKTLFPALLRHRATLLLKAHPRDAGYSHGVYTRLFEGSGIGWRDVTALSLDAVMALRPAIVITQFSSLALEAGFYGVPSLSVLLDGAGASRLEAKKGYRIPPHCEAGAGAVARTPDSVTSTLSSLLVDAAKRAAIVQCFDSYFEVEGRTLPTLVAQLREIGSEAKKTH